jgi:hypothetical protein
MLVVRPSGGLVPAGTHPGDTEVSGTDPSVLTDAQLLQLCATVFEEHAERLFVYARDGRRLIEELRKRADGTASPVRQDVPSEAFTAVLASGEVVVNVHDVYARGNEPADEDWLPSPEPGRTNIRLVVIDDNGMAASMEFGNASPQLAQRVVSTLTDGHAKDVKRRQKETA